MEEKERYVIRYDLEYIQCLIDTEKNQGVGDYFQIVKLLNQQDKRIKELEEELEEINAGSDFIYEQSGATIKGLIKENQQLNQQLYDLPKKIVEEIKEELWKCQDLGNVIDNDLFISKIDTILKKYGGENENTK